MTPAAIANPMARWRQWKSESSSSPSVRKHIAPASAEHKLSANLEVCHTSSQLHDLYAQRMLQTCDGPSRHTALNDMHRSRHPLVRNTASMAHKIMVQEVWLLQRARVTSMQAAITLTFTAKTNPESHTL